MKLLYDENLSPSLAARLSEIFPGSAHVHDLGLGSAEDQGIWEHAREHGFTVVSKDLDFHDRSMLLGSPPKVIWIRLGNCSTTAVEQLLKERRREIERFVLDPDSALLALP